MENIVERAVILCAGGSIDAEHIQVDVGSGPLPEGPFRTLETVRFGPPDHTSSTDFLVFETARMSALRVGPCGRISEGNGVISEGNGVIDSLVLSRIREVLYSMICSPLITPHYASWTNMLLN